MSNDKNVGMEYLRVVISRFNALKANAERALEQLQSDHIHWSLNEESNSIAVIVQHMSGNMLSRWTDFLNSDGEKPNRNRDDEFVDSIQSMEELLQIWNRGWGVFLDALQALTGADLLKIVHIRNEPHTVMEAIERQMSHYSYHVGQIVFIAKQLKSDAWNTLSIPREAPLSRADGL
ncbi:DUF1572 family protein [Paenibacillus apiarius]|uniref:DUF1572 family protein n=1 Tax=Paenibacillus apiarius TaxID=46240 RepID=UPI00197D4675|nr:DUF1572 family protein [Paenibacillus apiarius]MBN3526737.1 DUF1572 family protein [Paenibacillus apiarius]